MPASGENWSAKPRIVGDLERPDHCHLSAEDNVPCFGDYTARAGWRRSSINQLIHNLKKKPNTRGTPRWDCKLRAIKEAGKVIAANILPVVPIPDSRGADPAVETTR
jgi:hypothetical protein